MPTDALKHSHPDPLAPEKLLITVEELSRLVSLSVRTLRRRDSAGEIPGRVKTGGSVRYRLDVIREWVRLGLPEPDRWGGSLGRTGVPRGKGGRR